MSEKKGQWPFSPTEGEGAAREHERAVEREREREAHMRQMAAQAESHQQSRNNRLIVGGKAHVRKRGLS